MQQHQITDPEQKFETPEATVMIELKNGTVVHVPLSRLKEFSEDLLEQPTQEESERLARDITQRLLERLRARQER